MCDERERLIEYLYEACDADEQRRVAAHLASCEECREEISALRAVRLDLLAWDVPEHGSVWKPFAPARTTPWWQEVPAWALAAAASVMFLLGIGGGLVGRQFSPVQAAAGPTLTSPIPTVQPAPVLTSADMSSLERRIATIVQGRLEARVPPVAAHLVPAGLSEDQTRTLVQALLVEGESRQAQRIREAVRAITFDSETRFVRQSAYNAYLRNDLPYLIRQEIASALAMQQQQGGNK